MKTLKAEYCGHISDTFLAPLCANSPDLECLSFCSVGKVGIEGMNAIKSLTNLKSLKIGWSRTLDDFHLLGVEDTKIVESSRRFTKRITENGQPVEVASGKDLNSTFCNCDFTNGFQSLLGKFLKTDSSF